MRRLKLFLQKRPVFLFLLPSFFVLHGFAENFGLVTARDASELLFYYLIASALLTAILFIFYNNLSKAALISSLALAFNFFFGTIHDLLKKIAANTLIVKYSFILPVSFIGFIVLIIYLRKVKNKIGTFFLYVNFLFFILILIDSVTLLSKSVARDGTYSQPFREKFVSCDSCSKPDIYLIVSDEYAGKKELSDIFSFNNVPFERELTSRGFHIVSNTKSNYNGTIYSVASLLSMNYIKNLKSKVVNWEDMFRCSKIIKENNVVVFFKELGYTIHNCSIFDIEGEPNPVSVAFFPTGKSIITAQTFLRRIKRDLSFHFATKAQIEKILKQGLVNNNTVDGLTRKIASQKENQPKFVYTHLVMPHYAYYFDSSGKENSIDKLYDDYKLNKEAYLQYLIYTNKKLLQLIDQIRSSSTRPTAIVLLSDHGYRQFTDSVDHQYYFMTLNAIYLPTASYSSFYDGMTNVNEFRIILNSLFKQQFPLLKDSTTFLGDPVSKNLR